MQMVSPTVVAAGVGLFLFCAKLQISPKLHKPINFFASGALGVYLIHVNIFIWENVMTNAFAHLATLHPVVMTLGVIGCGLGIFLVCATIDNLREWLFRLLRIPSFCQKIETLVTRATDRLLGEKEKV